MKTTENAGDRTLPALTLSIFSRAITTPAASSSTGRRPAVVLVSLNCFIVYYSDSRSRSAQVTRRQMLAMRAGIGSCDECVWEGITLAAEPPLLAAAGLPCLGLDSQSSRSRPVLSKEKAESNARFWAACKQPMKKVASACCALNGYGGWFQTPRKGRYLPRFCRLFTPEFSGIMAHS